MRRFSRTGSSMLSFPPFGGVTKQLILANLAVYFLLLIAQHAAPRLAFTAVAWFALMPLAVAHGFVWQLATYSFLNTGVLHIAFNMLTLWFIGAYLESARGSRWFVATYFLSAIGGAAIGTALSFTHLLHASPVSVTTGADAAIFGLLAAFAVLFGDLEMYMFPLPIGIRAKYLVIVYMLILIAFLMGGHDPLGYFTILAGALIGFLYARRVPRRSAGTPFSERLFGLRNRYYRWKRRRAARKFEVYMRKQNRDVRFDEEGRYIDPDAERRPNGKGGQNGRWMN